VPDFVRILGYPLSMQYPPDSQPFPSADAPPANHADGPKDANHANAAADTNYANDANDATATRMAADAPTGSEPASRSHPKAAWRAYAQQSFAAALFRAPQWSQLPSATPAFVLTVCLLNLAVMCVLSYLVVAGNARFYPQAITAGWLGVAALAWACWSALRPARRLGAAASVSSELSGNAPTDVATLFSLSSLTTLMISALASLIYIALFRANALPDEGAGVWFAWCMWGAGPVWAMCAQIVLLTRASRSAGGSAAAIVLLIVSVSLTLWAQPSAFWYEDYSESAAAVSQRKWDQSYLQPEKLLKQAGVLDAALAALPAQRPGVVDTYVIAYSPYASEDVFLKESEVVTRVMGERFGTTGRTLRMVNHGSSVETIAWATPDNLKKALDHIGTLIDPAEDMVFIHFASHGGSDGKLAANFWPVQIDALTAPAIRTMLDDANIPLRVISVSACYSGSWIEPLRTQGTLIMTASDADHTSYGCGSKSDLTFFTRAVFSEQLSLHTRSFEAALNAARPIIEAREKEAGKKDGFSNPQLFVGDVARLRLERWTQEIERSAVSRKP
jgi:Peptidase C13 family